MTSKILKLAKAFIAKLMVSTKRFPEALLFATAAVITAIFINHHNFTYPDPLRDQLNRLTMIFALGVPLYLSIRVLLERELNKIKSKLIPLLAGLVVLAGYHQIFIKEINTISIIRYVGVTLVLYLLFTSIPFILKKERYELQVVKLMTNLFITYLYSIVLYLGLAAILFTIDQLFSVNVSYKLYYDIFLIVAGIFAPAYFLADVPTNNQQLVVEEYPKVLRVLLQFIVMPLLVAYSTILYVYFGKIIATQEWPQGMVSHLVLWFSIISTLVIFLVYQLKEQNQWTNIFIKYFPKWVIPLLIMMFVAIGIRIRSYGITENRYFVVAAGLWVFGSMLYLALKKLNRNILIVLSLAIITLISVFGPVSAFSLSKYSQNNRFEALLKEYQMLQDGKIIKPQQQLKEEERQRISSIIAYFNYQHSLRDLKLLPEGFKLEEMEAVFGFRLYDGVDYQRKYFYLYANEGQSLLNINEYDLFTYMSFYRNNQAKSFEKGEYTISYSKNNGIIEITKDKQLIYSKSIDEIAKDFEKYNGKQDLSMEDLMYQDDRGDIKVMYLFKHINGYQTGETSSVESAEFYIFIKLP
ncbi:MAG: DUF4153 domain-containing protein [Flavobacteriales bacterium]|nr:DUF4153 domain-containing protein [Flavobacteriales bacterium]